ncbi:ATP-binding protein [Sphingobacterium sp. IITKGP-BTPF85]|uniref:ATP-binding protein n=1 Tax=Sphingobacterium sp. IITKGP-BTPF85 TaxID=1338009 RepID=UPI00038A096D|nr:ATP-binding protein [Sphingobacterium sp. IITKGP-BTPF85]KKX46908.1 hypothetical protein L950_0229375 [Sphingobacterium sp. IITKGP-BTPF85]
MSSTRKTLSEDADQLVHTIDLYIGNAKTFLDSLILNKNIEEAIIDQLYLIKNSIDKSLKVSELILKSNFDLKLVNQRINLTKYIHEYIATNSIAKNKINFSVVSGFSKYYYLSPLDLEISLDNLISNSEKAGAKNIIIEMQTEQEKLLAIYYYDDGTGVPERFVRNPELIFDLGARQSESKGSGIGMYDVKKRVKNMKGEISFIGNGLKLKGASFKILI